MKFFLWILVLLAGNRVSGQTPKPGTTSFGKLKLIGEYTLPFFTNFRSTNAGGLSGIDYDKKRDQYYLICDDRSAINPARYYTAKLYFNSSRVDSAVIVDVNTLLQPDGTPYPPTTKSPLLTPDPESLRYDPVTNSMIWTSEGERTIRGKDTIISNPSINIISPQGKFLDSIPLPKTLLMQRTEKGPRQNGVLEGSSFSSDYKTFFVNVEEPLYEDGPRAETTPNNAWIRIFRFNMATKANTAQYAYKLDPIAHPSTPATAFKVNGVPDILWAGNEQLLVMERSFSTGKLACTIKIFLVDLSKAGNIINNTSLKKTPPAKPLKKKLLLNMDSLGMYIDNVEGMTFGPTLPNGHKTLVLVADNNFVPLEKTQFFVFEIIP
jgi:hypothetical protein